MTADEEFRDWFMLQSKMPYRTPEEIAEMAWFASKSAATKATAARCVEICEQSEPECCGRTTPATSGMPAECCGEWEPRDKTFDECAAAIKQEFDLG